MIDIRSFRDFVRLYYIFHRPFWTAFGVTAIAIVVGAFALPPKFASEARLLVKAGRENSVVPIEAGDRATYMPYATQRDPIIDDEKMLTGQPVVSQVAHLYLEEMAALDRQSVSNWKAIKRQLNLGVLAVSDAVRQVAVWLGLTESVSAEDKLVDKLLDKFKVTHGPGSNVMELSFVWDDPHVAQRVMQTWIKVYNDERISVLGRKSLVAFYDGKVRDADMQIELLKEQLRGGLDQINGVSAEERLTAITKRLNELRDRRAEIQAERTALEQGVAYAAGRAGKLSSEVVAERDVGLGPNWLALSTQLADLKRQRADALRVFKDSAPAVASLNESIANLEAQLKAEERNTQRSEKLAPNELKTLVMRNQLEKSVRLQELVSMAQTFDKEIEQLTQARRKVFEKEPSLARIEQALQVAEKSRLLYLDNLEHARVDQALDDSRINNIAVIQAASFSPGRVSPNSPLLLALAAPAGLLVGLLVIYVCALMDKRIHDGGRMTERFGVPLWTTVKELAGGTGDNEFHASLHRIYGTLPLERIREQGLVLGLASSRAGEGVTFLIGHLRKVLEAQGLTVRVNPSPIDSHPGEVVLIDASNLQANQSAFVALAKADLIVLVIEARASLVPAVDNALGMLRTAFTKVDGLILNRRRFEVPARVLQFIQH